MADDIAIHIDHVSKMFKLPHEKQTSIKGALINATKGRQRGFERQRVLDDVAFDIKKGEFFGIAGRNGSGKSTLLKIIAGIYKPSQGAVSVSGSLTPFIELGVGFNPELTGRENVFLNGALLGFTRKDMLAMYDDIVDFAELGKFMDQKLKNYSSGMQVRLAFSIAIRAQSDILVIDEVLAVGDAAFQQKCFEYFYQLKREKRTIVFVSHDMESMQKFCDRVAIINDSHLEFLGSPVNAAVMYKELNFPAGPADAESFEKPTISLQDASGKTKAVYPAGEELRVRIRWPLNERAQYAGVAIHRDDGLYVFGTNTLQPTRSIAADQNQLEYQVQLNLGNGKYYIEAAIFGKDESEKVYYIAEGPSFVVHNTHAWQGVTELAHKWVKP